MSKVVITPDNPKVAEGRLTGFAPVDMLLVALKNRELLAALIHRDVEVRYRGSALGVVWVVAVPLVMLCAYTFVFTVVFKTRFGGVDSLAQSSLALYSGIILFSLFSEPVNRGPSLISDNVAFVKRVVFPLRIMPWMAMATASFGATIALALLAVFHLFLNGLPPAEAALVPVALVPVVLLSLGTTWLLAAVGVFVRDIKHLAGMGTTLLMFVTPVFYPVSQVPERFRALVYMNPLSYSLETMRGLLFSGQLPHAATWLAYLIGCWFYASVGYAVFARLQRKFADVV